MTILMSFSIPVTLDASIPFQFLVSSSVSRTAFTLFKTSAQKERSHSFHPRPIAFGLSQVAYEGICLTALNSPNPHIA